MKNNRILIRSLEPTGVSGAFSLRGMAVDKGFESDGYKYPIEQKETNSWIELRGRVIKKQNARCAACNRKKVLDVHHRYYVAHRKAWEYPEIALIALCEKCHSEEHRNQKKKADFETLLEMFFDPSSLDWDIGHMAYEAFLAQRDLGLTKEQTQRAVEALFKNRNLLEELLAR